MSLCERSRATAFLTLPSRISGRSATECLFISATEHLFEVIVGPSLKALCLILRRRQENLIQAFAAVCDVCFVGEQPGKMVNALSVGHFLGITELSEVDCSPLMILALISPSVYSHGDSIIQGNRTMDRQ